MSEIKQKKTGKRAISPTENRKRYKSLKVSVDEDINNNQTHVFSSAQNQEQSWWKDLYHKPAAGHLGAHPAKSADSSPAYSSHFFKTINNEKISPSNNNTEDVISFPQTVLQRLHGGVGGIEKKRVEKGMNKEMKNIRKEMSCESNQNEEESLSSSIDAMTRRPGSV